MPKLYVSFDDTGRAEAGLESLDEAGFPLGTFRLIAEPASQPRGIVRLLQRVFRRAPEAARRVYVEVEGDEARLEEARRILEAGGGSAWRTAP